MTTMTLPPSDTLVRLSVGTPSRRYKVVEDVVIEVSTQFKFPNSSPRLGSGVGAKKKVDEGGRGLKRCKSCGEGRGNAPAHGVAVGEVGEKGLNKHKERKARRCGGQLIRCGALCLLLPALPDFRFRIGKGKGKGKGKEEAKVEAEAGGCNSIISISISRRVSLEKFECGSWASSGMVVHNHDYEDGESGTGSLYFDLPMELIRNSGAGVQTQSPVKAAFVFDKDRKGVHHLPVWSKAKSTEESGSSGIASPCIISPRLRKAREEFNELLEAHAYTL